MFVTAEAEARRIAEEEEAQRAAEEEVRRLILEEDARREAEEAARLKQIEEAEKGTYFDCSFSSFSLINLKINHFRS